MKKLFGLIMGGAVLFAAPAVTHAAYGQPSVLVTSSTSAPVPGAPITYTATGCTPGSAVTFTVNSAAVGTSSASSTGSASTTTTAPTTVGTYSVGVACGGESATTLVSVPAPPVAPGRGLPATGTNSQGWVQTSILLTAAGAALVGVAGFRRRARRIA